MADEKKEQIVDLTKRETAYATDKAPHHAAGQELNYAPALIEMMVKNGWATKTAPKKADK